MGYYTNFEITANTYEKTMLGEQFGYILDNKILTDLQNEVEKMNLPDGYIDEDRFSAYGKWYEWKDDMRLLSSKFPDLIFTIEGEGEESGDIWRAYVMNGALQFCAAKIIFDDFNPIAMHEGLIPENYSYSIVR